MNISCTQLRENTVQFEHLRNLLNFVGSKICHPAIYVANKSPSSLIPQTLKEYILCARHYARHDDTITKQDTLGAHSGGAHH